MTERNQARPQAAQLTPNDEGRLTNLLFTNQLRPLTLTQWRRSIAEQPLFGWLKLLDCKGGFFSRETNLTASILQQIYSLTQELQFAIKQAHHLGRHQLVEQLFEDAARLVPLPETHQPEEIRRQLQHSYDQLNLLWEMHRDAQR